MSLSLAAKIALLSAIFLLAASCGGGAGNSRDTIDTADHANPLSAQSSSANTASSTSSDDGSISNNKNSGHSSLASRSSAGATENRLSQTLSFSEPVIRVGFNSNSKTPQWISNPVTAPGTGAVTYQSNNPDIAYIDDRGAVQALPNTSGSAIITATIAADDKYQSASASYTLYTATYIVDSYEDMCAPPCSQRIAVASEQVELKLHQITVNSVSRYGDGELRYSSGDSQVASIDSNGLITARGIGTATIKVEVAATQRFSAASAEFQVKVAANDQVSLAPATVPLTAWIGARDSQMTFPEANMGFLLFSSSDTECDFSQVLNCANGQLEVLRGTTIITSATSLNAMGKHVLKDRQGHTSFRMVAAATFEPRIRHEAVNFKDALWLVGGQLASENLFESSFKNDIWSSADGISWIEQSANGGFSTRVGHKVVAFNNRLWLIGGNDWKLDYLIPGADNGRKNDIWSSRDGITWTQQLSHASFSPRYEHQLVVFNNQLWLIGGNDKTGDKNDIWSSHNGITWVRQRASADFSPRSHFQLVVFNDKLWLIGSHGDDVWSSSDGIQWAHETLTASFSPREGHKVIVYRSKLWLIGGYDNNDVWSSADGLAWVKQTPHAAFSPRAYFQLTSLDNQLIMSGGLTKEGFSNDVWATTDGVEWRRGFSGIFQFPQ